MWGPVFYGTSLNYEYLQRRVRGAQLSKSLIIEDVLNNINAFVWCSADEDIHIARNAGLSGNNIVCKYNNWEIGKNTPTELSDEIERSKNITKDIVVIQVDSLNQEVKHFSLPLGMVGIRFSYQNQTSDISYAVSLYNDWKNSNR